jgi:adenosylcobinamide-GDP ribazoletransferase
MKWQPLQKPVLRTEKSEEPPREEVSPRVEETPRATESVGQIRKFVEEIGLAFALLTRFRVPAFKIRSTATYASAFWAFPIVGAVMGAAGALVFGFCMAAGLSMVAAAILTITALLLLGGGLHEDGFSDFWDGIGGGRTRERKLEIMRDSRQGAYGALALVIMVALQIVLLTDIYIRAGMIACLTVLIASESVARGMIAVPCYFINPARGNGLGIVMKSASRGALLTGAVLGAVIALVFMLEVGIALIIGAGIGAASITFLASRFLGGFTGDVLGATVVTARLSALCFAAAVS